jgi:hypothetical protein
MATSHTATVLLGYAQDSVLSILDLQSENVARIQVTFRYRHNVGKHDLSILPEFLVQCLDIHCFSPPF